MTLWLSAACSDAPSVRVFLEELPSALGEEGGVAWSMECGEEAADLTYPPFSYVAFTTTAGFSSSLTVCLLSVCYDLDGVYVLAESMFILFGLVFEPSCGEESVLSEAARVGLTPVIVDAVL